MIKPAHNRKWERNKTLVDAYRAGVRQAELARRFKLSRERVRQIIAAANRRGE